MNIEPYQFFNAERLRFGRFPVLDAILYRWARRIEETLFEQVQVEVYSGASVFEEMRFSTFFATLRRPRPIYFFQLEPFEGTGLFVADNRFSAFCLRQSGAPAAEPKLTPRNHARLQQVVQAMLADFDESWRDVHPVHARLKKITTYPFRARILNPYEPCLVAQIHLSGRGFSSRLTWCIPRTLLEPVLERLGQGKVIPALSIHPRAAPRLDRERVLEGLRYSLRVSMGRLDAARALKDLGVGAVLPLDNEVGGRALLEVEGTPVLVGSMGQVEQRYALRVDGPYVPPKGNGRPEPAQFQPIQWPTALAE